MKTCLAALLLAAPAIALAQPQASPAAPGAGYHERLYERYCEKLREGPEAYARFVKRLRVVHGYTFEDFAPREPGAPVVAACRVGRDKLATAPAQPAGR